MVIDKKHWTFIGILLSMYAYFPEMIFFADGMNRHWSYDHALGAKF